MVSIGWACLGLDHGQYQQVSLLTNLPYQLYVVCVRAVGMLEKFKLSWRLTAHQHPSEGLKNPSHHGRPLNSLVSLLNDAVYGPLQLPGWQGRCVRVRAGCSSLFLGKLDVLPSMRVSIAWALSMATGPYVQYSLIRWAACSFTVFSLYHSLSNSNARRT